MALILDISCGVLWSITYIAAIVLGARNKIWCIPKVSICMNFSWELLVVIKRLLNVEVYGIGFWVQLTWCLLDLGVIATWQLFQKHTPHAQRKDMLLFISIFLFVYLTAYVGEEWGFSVFLINCFMSAEFVVRLKKEIDVRWKSQIIAVTKLCGTLAATILNGFIYWNPLILWIGGLCLILDVYYLLLLAREGENRLCETS